MAPSIAHLLNPRGRTVRSASQVLGTVDVAAARQVAALATGGRVRGEVGPRPVVAFRGGHDTRPVLPAEQDRMPRTPVVRRPDERPRPGALPEDAPQHRDVD